MLPGNTCAEAACPFSWEYFIPSGLVMFNFHPKDLPEEAGI